MLFTRELAKRLEGTGVTANALHPGVVATGLSSRATGVVGFLMRLGRSFLTSPTRGAQTSLHLACSKELDGVSGRYFEDKRDTTASPEARDDSVAAKLWAISGVRVGLDRAAA